MDLEQKKKGNCLFHSSHCVFTAVYSIHSSLYLIEKKFATIEIFVGLPGPTSGRSAGGVNDTETKKKGKKKTKSDGGRFVTSEHLVGDCERIKRGETHTRHK